MIQYNVLHVLHWAYVASCYLQPQRTSNRSTPSTPPYSQTVALENQMIGPHTHITPIPLNLVGGNSRSHQLAPPTNTGSPGSTSSSSSGSSTGISTRKRGRKTFVDPCAIAPLRKRRIQVIIWIWLKFRRFKKNCLFFIFLFIYFLKHCLHLYSFINYF